jgi:hypothetical protein
MAEIVSMSDAIVRELRRTKGESDPQRPIEESIRSSQLSLCFHNDVRRPRQRSASARTASPPFPFNNLPPYNAP